MRLDLLAAAATHTAAANNHSILIYGPPKTGKTRFVATAAEIPEVRRVVWFDLENGFQTLLTMGLSPEAMQKIELIRIPDTRARPIAVETMLKAIAAGVAVSICEEHGKAGCAECKRTGKPTTDFHLASLGHSDLVVIDSGSQLGDSALAAACLGKDIGFKPSFDEYGQAGFWLSDILSVVQQCHNTNFVVITHELVDTEEINGKQTDKIFPLMGTRAFCRKVSKYFGTVAYFHIKMGKHTAGSSSTYKSDTMTGSRVNAVLEKSKDLCMRDILIAGGILGADSSAPSSPSPKTEAKTEAKPEAKPNPLASMLAKKAAG